MLTSWFPLSPQALYEIIGNALQRQISNIQLHMTLKFCPDGAKNPLETF